jgi:hypothetical protein
MKKILLALILCVEVSCKESPEAETIYEFNSLEEIINCPVEVCNDTFSQGKFGSKSIHLTGIDLKKYHIYPSDTLEAYYYEQKLKQLWVRKNSVAHGTHLDFNEDGKLISYGRIDFGRSNGMFQTFNEQGELYEVSLVIDGETIYSKEY